MDRSNLWCTLALGICLISFGIVALAYDEIIFAKRIFPIPFWAWCFLIPIGEVLCIISIRALSGKEDKKISLPDPEADQALEADRARHEQLYFEEHGETPAQTQARLCKPKKSATVDFGKAESGKTGSAEK